ncbi:MAG: hypothetical protein JNM98_19795 [Rhodocyclaceae bacterium]|nr:hypothetical protein [Rhodocyclaceae bacterium]
MDIQLVTKKHRFMYTSATILLSVKFFAALQKIACVAVSFRYTGFQRMTHRDTRQAVLAALQASAARRFERSVIAPVSPPPSSFGVDLARISRSALFFIRNHTLTLPGLSC